MEIFDINHYPIKAIYTYNDRRDHYGLKVLFEFEKGYLFFDSSRFRFGSDMRKISQYRWKKLNYEYRGNLTINDIREEELVYYFVLFSNEAIFHIYQFINGDEFWYQEFEIIDRSDRADRYDEVVEHMNEDWITQPDTVIEP